MRISIVINTSLYKFIFFLLLLSFWNCEDSSNNPDDDQSTDDGHYFEIEITPEGGDLYISDGKNNSISVIFPKNSVYTPTSVSLSFITDRDDFSIETPHIAAFEIKPHDLLLYRPISIMVNVSQPIAELEKTMIFRETTDQFLVPLADHEYFDNPGSEIQSIRAFSNSAGVFAEGTMSPEQVESHLNTLLETLYLTTAQPSMAFVDDPCDTELNKAIWDTWKEFGNGAEELNRVAILMQLGVEFENGSTLTDAICGNFLEDFAYTVLNKCIPENICDHNYEYIINDALSEMQKCQSFSDELYESFYSRWDDIQNACIDQGLLKFRLTCEQYKEINLNIEPPSQLDWSFHSENASVPLSITTISSSGFAEIDEEDDIWGGIPLFSLTGSGTIFYYPGTEYEKICDVSAKGYLRVDIAGSKDASDNFSLSIITHHYLARNINCPGEPELMFPVFHDLSLIFSIELNPQNNFRGTTTAEGDTNWVINAELKLP